MKFKTIINLVKQKKLFLLLKLGKAFQPFYRLCFASSAASSGFLEIFSKGPVTFDDILSKFSQNPKSEDMLTSWLQLGIKLNEVESDGRGYKLAGFSKKFVLPEYDAYQAYAQEVVEMHHKIITKTPEMIKTNQRWNFTDHGNGSVVARSSRTIEPLIFETIESFYPSSAPIKLLEVGCGTGIYIKHAAMHNQRLKAVGLELQKDVYEMASKNIEKWGVNDRVTLKHEDIRDYKGEANFDIVSLHNNIYYFDVSERLDLLKNVGKLLKPGGFIILTTGCQGGSPIVEVLNLWSVTTNGHDRLPSVSELKTQFSDSGFTGIKSKQLIPGDQYHAFIGFKRSV